ncbi:poly(A)-specific ribonuclease [Podochytrium sp. JEL0797]|nr:poly(A)-specific ribonuclease [Podochytrium sp. JEL0797]
MLRNPKSGLSGTTDTASTASGSTKPQKQYGLGTRLAPVPAKTPAARHLAQRFEADEGVDWTPLRPVRVSRSAAAASLGPPLGTTLGTALGITLGTPATHGCIKPTPAANKPKLTFAYADEDIEWLAPSTFPIIPKRTTDLSLNKAAAKIGRVWKLHASKKRSLNLQHVGQTHHGQPGFKRFRDKIIRIQSLIRMHISRNAYLHQRQLRIQQRQHNAALEESKKAKHRIETVAAIKIQSVFRMHRLRSVYLSNRAALARANLVTAAVKIQSVWRMFYRRKLFVETKQRILQQKMIEKLSQIKAQKLLLLERHRIAEELSSSQTSITIGPIVSETPITEVPTTNDMDCIAPDTPPSTTLMQSSKTRSLPMTHNTRENDDENDTENEMVPANALIRTRFCHLDDLTRPATDALTRKNTEQNGGFKTVVLKIEVVRMPVVRPDSPTDLSNTRQNPLHPPSDPHGGTDARRRTTIRWNPVAIRQEFPLPPPPPPPPASDDPASTTTTAQTPTIRPCLRATTQMLKVMETRSEVVVVKEVLFAGEKAKKRSTGTPMVEANFDDLMEDEEEEEEMIGDGKAGKKVAGKRGRGDGVGAVKKKSKITIKKGGATRVAVANGGGGGSSSGVEALLWIGTERGRVLSLVPPLLSLHTCGYAATTSIRQLLSTDKGLLVLSGYTLSMRARHSLVPAWTVSANGSDSFLSMVISDSDILVSTTFGGLLCIGLRSGTVLRSYGVADNQQPGYVMMKNLKGVLCCATAAGVLHFRDLRAQGAKIVARIEAHSGLIADLDVNPQIATLATTGYSLLGSQMMPDPCIKLFDIRTPTYPKPSAPVVFSSDADNMDADASVPSFVRFGVGAGGKNVMGCQATGEFCFWSGAGEVSERYQTDLDGYMVGIDYSSTGDYLCITSSAGTVSLWSEKSDGSAQVNAYERESEIVDPLAERIHLDDNSPLSTIGMPYYTSKLLSATWPPSLLSEIGQPPARIPKEVLADVKMSDFVGYARNPGIGHRRNQSPRSVLMESARKAEEGPKFRSEQDREGFLAKGTKLGRRIGARDSPILEASSTLVNSSIPKPYRQVQIKYSKFGVEDFDFDFYNKTSHSGLETHIKNSYSNAMLQLLFFTPPLRQVSKSHICKTCSKPTCLLCELGFLFRMLEDAKGANCQATNFLHVFGKLPQALALGLFEHDHGVAAAAGTIAATAVSFLVMVHGFHRFILETISSEGGGGFCVVKGGSAGEEPVQATLVQQIMGIQVRNFNGCQGCKKEDVRDTIQFVVDMGFKLKSDDKNPTPATLPKFGTLLQEALQKETSAKAWCSRCNKYQLTTQSKQIKALPNFISLNLKLQLGDDAETVMDAYPDWMPMRIAIVLTGSELSVFELDKDAFKMAEFDGSEVAIYDLKGVISEIKNDEDVAKSHLVSHILVDNESEWLLFNDFSVQPIPASEVIQFTKWKTPAVLQYARVDVESLIDYEKLAVKRSLENLFVKNPILNRRRDLAIMYTPLKMSEFPLKPGFMVAIDAEFVSLQKEETEIRSDGSKSMLMPSKLGLARVSVLRGESKDKLECVPLMDDYIAIQDTIVDYLTEFSGINLGDLDPSSSTKPLVPLKVAYQKLRYLVDIGCVFVGHGLKKDFRTINIIVPPEQIIDTVDIYFIKERQRKLSLRFLSWSLLQSDIQQHTHDSIEDAKAALLLYKKYLELSAQGIFQEVLETVYEDGRRLNFKVPS